jgi:hypothetical protein
MNKAAFLSIGNRIKEQCTNIKHIDLYNAQYMPDMDGVTKQFQKPAVFIEFGETMWDAETNGVQEGDGLCRVHVVMQKFTDTYKIFDKDDAAQLAVMQTFDVCNEVHAALHGWQADNTLSSLRRQMSTPDSDYDMLIVEVYEYHFRDCDASADTMSNMIEKQIEDVRATGEVV